MKIYNNVSAQKISWVKSNKRQLEKELQIHTLYYPESLSELQNLICEMYIKEKHFEIVGYCSNTLILPSYRSENVICTKYVNCWIETDDTIICDCGVAVAKLSRFAVGKGYVGFEGLTDLPGTVAAAVYGNCGCRGCFVNDIVKSFLMILPDGRIVERTIEDLNLSYRSSALKRGEINGVILSVILHKVQGDVEKLLEIAAHNHRIRKEYQPSANNNLGTTFNGGLSPTIKGWIFIILEKIISIFTCSKDSRVNFPILLKICGKENFIPFVYYWNRYMFINEQSHQVFPEYQRFINSLYKDCRLEIEILK